MAAIYLLAMYCTISSADGLTALIARVVEQVVEIPVDPEDRHGLARCISTWGIRIIVLAWDCSLALMSKPKTASATGLVTLERFALHCERQERPAYRTP